MVYVFLADGFEELEAIAPIDIMKRAGAEVKTVGVGKDAVCGSHGIVMRTDITESQIKLDGALQGIVLPGGMPGTLNLEKSAAVNSAIEYCAKNDLLIAAICAAPSILGKKGLLSGREAICFPGFEQHLKGAEISEKYVAEDGNFITAKGAGVAVDFGLKIAARLCGKEKSDAVRAAIQCEK